MSPSNTAKRDAPPFSAPENDNDLLDRICAELSDTSNGVLLNAEEKAKLNAELKAKLKGDVNLTNFPCRNEQEFQRAVTIVNIVIAYGAKGKNDEAKVVRRKSSVAALKELPENGITLELRGQQSSSVHPQEHPEAKQETKTLVLRDISLEDFEMTGIPSMFMQHILRENGKPLCYYNERDIRYYVESILTDAVYTCNAIIGKFWSSGEGSPAELAHRIEAGIWSEKPDHVVVFDTRSNAPLVTIEVKKPLPPSETDKTLADFPRVSGQGFDYLQVSRLQGHSNPMHITTTLEESYVAWLPGNDYVAQYFNPAVDLQQFFEENIHGIKSHKGEAARPEGLLQEAADCPTTDGTLKISPIERLIFTSQSFKLHNLFQVMVNTIICSMHGSTRALAIPKLNPLERVTSTALKLNKTLHYEWVNLDVVVQGPLKPKPSWFKAALQSMTFADSSLYAVAVVRFGSTSKVFRIITSKGHEGVAKMYVKEDDDEETFQLSEEEFDKSAKESVTKELEVFEAVYPNTPVSKVMLCGHPSLLMPFFAPIQSGHMNYKNTIREHLKRVKNKKSYLAYESENMRWRHIGLYGTKEEIHLFDFNNMKQIATEDVDDYIEEHWEELESHIPKQINEPPTP